MTTDAHPVIPGAEETTWEGGPVGVLVLHGFTGNPGSMRELAERLRGIRDSGYDQLAISLPPGHEDTMLERWSEVFAAL